MLSLLDCKWSPQQIAGIVKRGWPDDPSMHVSHEPIYTAIDAQHATAASALAGFSATLNSIAPPLRHTCSAECSSSSTLNFNSKR